MENNENELGLDDLLSDGKKTITPKATADTSSEEPISTSLQILKNVKALATMAVQRGTTSENGPGQVMRELNSDKDVSKGYTVRVTFNHGKRIEFIDVRKNGPAKKPDSYCKQSPDITLRVSRDRMVYLTIDKRRVKPLPLLDRPQVPSTIDGGMFDSPEDVRVFGPIDRMGENTLNFLLSFTQDAIKGMPNLGSTSPPNQMVPVSG